MKDLVYILGDGSDCDDLELFYSLRSAFKHFRNYGRIFVIGSAPKWKSTPGVPFIHIPAADATKDAQHNVRAKLLVAINDPRISDSFVLMNDDFFFLRDADANELPLYRQGTIPLHIQSREFDLNPYVDQLRKTEYELRRKGLPVLDFEVHAPIVYHKSSLAAVLDDFNFDWSGQRGLLIRSLYGNYVGAEGVRLADNKIDFRIPETEIYRRIAERPFLSTGPGSMTPAMEAILTAFFPAP